jgi:hypothetical protein
MNIDDLKVGEVKQLIAMFGVNSIDTAKPLDNKMIGKYVIVRCRDAGVHTGILESHNGRECVLTESRRLWYWKAAKGAFLSSVASVGLDDCSKVGTDVPRIHLTENCEIIECSSDAEKSIRAKESHNE